MFTSKFEKLCNEHRENKRMIEELTAMNDGLNEAFKRYHLNWKQEQIVR